MTEDRRFKRAIRARMAETGEKYTEARRALLAHDRETDATPAEAPGVPLGWFTDQAYNAILLAEDEARMLGQPRVEPEHLLLAVARIGNVDVLLARAGISAGTIYAAVVAMGGFGAELVLGPVPRSPAGEGVLRQAVAAAAGRGIRSPSTEHLLLGLAEHGRATAVLGELGVVDVIALVDEAYRPMRPAVDPETLERREHELAARVRMPPSPGPIPPVFERFTTEARRAVEAAIERAHSYEDPYVLPAHLLLGLLGVEEGVVASVRARHERQFDAAAARATEIMADRASNATGIFSAPARRLVAEEVLKIADRHGHRSLGTGHLLLAVVENADGDTAGILDALPDARQIVAEVTRALPGDEHT
jgi:ATP-dependent Clp protease ATP-binding subunit ClpA